MSRTITVRDVPDEVADELQQRARRSGRSLQAYLADLLQKTASRRPLEDIFAEVEATLSANDSGATSASIVAALREDRDDARR